MDENIELNYFTELLNNCVSIKEVKDLCFSIVNYDEDKHYEWTPFVNSILNKREFVRQLLENTASPAKEVALVWSTALKHGECAYSCRTIDKDKYYQLMDNADVEFNDKCLIMACMIENCLTEANYYFAEEIADELSTFDVMPIEAIRTLMKYFTYTRRYDVVSNLNEKYKSYGYLNDLYSDCLSRKDGKKKEYMPKKDKEKNYLAFLNDCLGVKLEESKKSRISDDNYPQFEFIDTMDFDSFVAYDVETSGLSRKFDYITEIGAMKVVNGEIIETEKFKFQELVHPYGKPKKIPEEVIEITGITNEMVSDARTVQEVFNDFAEFIGDFVLVGYNNKRFDSAMLRRAGRYANVVIHNKQFDLLPVAKEMTDLADAKLNTVANYFGIENPRAHRAYADAITTAKLYMEIKQKCKNN